MFDDPYPYIVPVNFGEEIIGDQVVFYIHTGYEGKKNDLLAKNPNIAFEMDCNHEPYYRESNGCYLPEGNGKYYFTRRIKKHIILL